MIESPHFCMLRGSLSRFLSCVLILLAMIIGVEVSADGEQEPQTKAAPVPAKHDEAEPHDGKRANVLFIVVDTLRADHLEAYGYHRDTMPILTQLAAEGASGRTERLALAIEQLPEPYDFILMDCPPNIGILTFNALRAANEVIIPLETSYFAMHGVGKLLETIGLLEERIGHELRIRILPTLFDGRTRFAKRALAEIRETYKDLVFDTVIRQNVRLREAAQRGVPISGMDKRCYGFVDYMSLALEILFDRPEEAEEEAPALVAAEATESASAMRLSIGTTRE